MDDVDRLSRGEGAKIRGTGCRDIPHRLNEQEHAGFKAAKKKVGRILQSLTIHHKPYITCYTQHTTLHTKFLNRKSIPGAT
jgi:hypothetical protein